MKNEDVIKILSNSQIQLISSFADKEYLGEALTTAIETLKRIDVEKIAIIFANELVNNDVEINDIEDLFSVKDISQSIYNYLTEGNAGEIHQRRI